MIALIFAAIIASYLIFKQSIKLVEPEFLGIENLEFERSEGEIQTLKLNIILKNPNKFRAQLLNMEIDVYSEEVKIADIAETKVLDIPTNTPFPVPLTVRVNAKTLLESQGISGLLEKLLNSKREILLKFEGYIRIKIKNQIYKIPVNFHENIQIK